MANLRKISIGAALAFNLAAPLFAGPALYSEAASPWSAKQAIKLPPAMTADFLKEVKDDLGPAAAAGLAEKKVKVAALLKRFKTCALNSGDLAAADKYFTPEFRAEVRYFASGGCAEFRNSASGPARAARSASLENISGFSVSGALATREGSARFFDGAAAGAAAAPVQAGRQVYQAAGPAGQPGLTARSSRRLASIVPAPGADDKRHGNDDLKRPASLGEDGMVHQAMNYWNSMREDNWEAYKKAKPGSAKAKALLKTATGAFFEGVLMYSNLSAVETDAARLRWDAKNGSGKGAIAADSAKLAFNSAVFILAFAPIPMLKVAKAALAGKGWAIAMLAAMGAGTVNHYVVHVAD